MSKNICYITFSTKFIKDIEKVTNELRQSLENEDLNNNKENIDNRTLSIEKLVAKYGKPDKSRTEALGEVSINRTLEIDDDDLEWITQELLTEIELLTFESQPEKRILAVRTDF